MKTPSTLEDSVIHALDFSIWKRAAVRQCFPGLTLIFVSDASQVPEGGRLVVWGMKEVRGALAPGVRVLRVEDGFIRSIGLGTDLIRPVSLVVDKRGIYYDATRESDLEYLFSNSQFDSALVNRSAELRRQIVLQGITKYNVGFSSWKRPSTAKVVILVPGQVETDASLQYGAPGIRSNIALLQAVRQSNPQAHIVYKPHPDVIAGLRAPGANESSAFRWCDELVTDVGMAELLVSVDKVAVLTSLAGFEALMRDKPVTCYGQPFYSGWGLTEDIFPVSRRRRSLTIDELVAGTLILYPLYVSRYGKGLISPEVALDELVTWRLKNGNRVPWWRGAYRMLLRQIVGVR